ncbi:MAG: cysteine hydrolase [Acetobacteraceae bacterium]|nr:cysteine hydrolase [Acetobacteraceae bacterium]
MLRFMGGIMLPVAAGSSSGRFGIMPLMQFGLPSARLASVLVALTLAACGSAPSNGSSSASSPSVSASAQPQATTLPAVPAPVAVSVDSAATAVLVMDLLLPRCTPTGRAACPPTIPAVNALIKKAHDARTLVVYTRVNNGTFVSDLLTPQASDITLDTLGPDKFIGTNLADQLKQKKISTLVASGTASNGAVLTTGAEAAFQGYTVVVPEDTISGDTPFNTFLTEYQLLQFPANPDNKPLADKAVTLSRSDLISFK